MQTQIKMSLHGTLMPINSLLLRLCSRCLATYVKLVKPVLREMSFSVTVFKYGGAIKQLPQTGAYSYAFLTD